MFCYPGLEFLPSLVGSLASQRLPESTNRRFLALGAALYYLPVKHTRGFSRFDFKPHPTAQAR